MTVSIATPASRGAKVAELVFVAVIGISLLWDAPKIISGDSAELRATSNSGSDLVRQALFVVLFMLLLSAIIQARRWRILLSIPVPFIPILIWCWLSLLWAIDPAAAVRRISFTTIVMLSIAYVVDILPPRRTIDLLLAVMCVALVLDWAAIPLFSLAVHQPGELDRAVIGDWRGLHGDKNAAGVFCALCFIVCLHESVRLRSVIGLFISAAAAVFLYQTHSKTSIDLVLVALLVGVLMEHATCHRVLAKFYITVLSISLALGAFYYSWIASSIMPILDDPASFTGRVQIWPVLLAFGYDHPLLGAGYGSFWGIGSESPVFRYGSGWVTTIFEGHNGYLDVLVQIGAIGLAIVIITLIVVPMWTICCRPLRPEVSPSLICSVVVFVYLHNLMETSLLDRANPAWVIFVIMYCLLFKMSSGSRPRRREGRPRDPFPDILIQISSAPKEWKSSVV